MKVFPKDWWTRRWHSFFGLWMVVYIVEHLLTNARAALPLGNDGAGFIHAVNGIHNLPFLKALEVLLIAIPFIYHALVGLRFAWMAKFNASSAQKNPGLGKYGRNHAFTWQRLTAYVLLVMIIFHVVQMRFLHYPDEVHVGGERSLQVVRISTDPGLRTVAQRLQVDLFDRSEIARLQSVPLAGVEAELLRALTLKPLKENQVMAVASDFGTADLLVVRNIMKSPLMMILYTFLVLAGVYHGFRGLWSASIVWGVALRRRAQQWISLGAIGLMLLFGFLGLSAIWLTYWVTLRY